MLHKERLYYISKDKKSIKTLLQKITKEEKREIYYQKFHHSHPRVIEVFTKVD